MLTTPSVTNCKGFSPHLSIHVHMYVDECINIKYIHGIGHESSSYVCQWMYKIYTWNNSWIYSKAKTPDNYNREEGWGGVVVIRE